MAEERTLATERRTLLAQVGIDATLDYAEQRLRRAAAAASPASNAARLRPAQRWLSAIERAV